MEAGALIEEASLPGSRGLCQGTPDISGASPQYYSRGGPLLFSLPLFADREDEEKSETTWVCVGGIITLKGGATAQDHEGRTAGNGKV
jgi:hypothetical protein